MKRSFCFFLLAPALLFMDLYSQQINAQATNYIRYGTGRARSMIFESDKEYFENFSDVKLFINEITVGFRLEYSSPSEFGQSYRGLKKKFVEFERDGFIIRAGNVSALFSRGLTLNLFENRSLAFDTEIEGIKAEYHNDFLKAIIVGGDVSYIDYSTYGWNTPIEERYSIRAASVEFRALDELSFGANYVYAKRELPTFIPNVNDTLKQELPEMFASFRIGSVDGFISYANKSAKMGTTDTSSGFGIFGTLGHSGNGYGLALEYKNYQFDPVDPLQRSNVLRPTRALPTQYAPIGFKEHAFTLLSRNPHVIDYNDEVGFQFDVYVAPIEKMTINLNAAWSSRHFTYRKDTTVIPNAYPKADESLSYLPSMNNERSPFWELYGEVEYYFSGDNSYFKIGFDRQNERLYADFNPASSEVRMSTSIPILVQYAMNDQWSVKIISEHQWIHETIYPQKPDFYNQLLTVQVAMSPLFSAGFRYETTTSTGEAQGIQHWLIGEGSLRIGKSHLLTISYGSERGGRVCTNGVCRVIDPFDGFRFTLLSRL
jgi:hypothetical protein